MQLYKTKSVVVEATRLTQVVNFGGGLVGDVGNWLVIGIDGQPTFMSHHEFFEKYEPSDDDSDTPTRFAQEKKAKAGKPRAKKGKAEIPAEEAA
jgi:hypothetical protein